MNLICTFGFSTGTQWLPKSFEITESAFIEPLEDHRSSSAYRALKGSNARPPWSTLADEVLTFKLFDGIEDLFV